MPAPRKYDTETRERAVRMYRDRINEHGDTKVAARRHVGALIDVNPDTLRNWIDREAPTPAPPPSPRPPPAPPS